nr:unnamed protein product [Spirometra erinaceieuropaei]
MRSFNSPLLFAVFITCFGSSFLIGYNLAIVNNIEYQISEFLQRTIIDVTNPPSWVDSSFLFAQVSSILVISAAVGAFLSGWLADAIGRPMLLWPTVCMAGTLLLLTIIVCVGNSKPPAEQSSYAATSVFLIYAFVACFAVGLGPIPAMIVSEIFRQGPRGAAYSLSQSIQWLCNLIVLFSFPTLNKLMKGYVYLPFLVIVAVCWVFFFLFMPETKNRSFDEIARDLAFGTIVVGKRSAAIQTPVFTKGENLSPDGGSLLRDSHALKSKE